MTRMTVRLPGSLHESLRHRAREEGVSLHQDVVDALMRQVALESVAEQRARFEKLRKRVRAEEAEVALEALLGARESECAGGG